MREKLIAAVLIMNGLSATNAYGQSVDPCAEAAALIDARLPSADKAHWFKYLESCTATNGRVILQGAQQSIAQRGRDELMLGEAAVGDNELKVAIAHFEAALAFDPANNAAAGKLSAAREALARRTVREAEDLLAMGKPDDAVKLLSEGGARDAEKRDAWFDWVGQRAWLAANGEFALEAITLLIALAWLGYRLWRRYRQRHVLVLRDFANNALAPGIEQAIQAMLINLSRGSGVSASTAFRVTRPLEDVPLPVDISKVLPASAGWMQVIPELVARVFPRRTLPITGVLHQDATLGAGVTIHVVTKDGSHKSETFWETQFGEMKPFDEHHSAHYPLAEYVAIWLLFHFSETGFSLLGTTEWRSYAQFRAGVNADGAEAKRLYLGALRIDDGLHAARLNLALLAKTPAERALVLDLLQCAADNAAASDATRYQARYSLASLKYDVGGPAPAIIEMKKLFKALFETCGAFKLKEELRNQSKAYYEELAGNVDDLKDLIPPADGTKPEPSGHIELEHYVAYLLPIARAMSLGLLISSNHQNNRALKALEDIALADQSPRVRYNLACACSLVAQWLASVRPAGDRAQLLAYLKQGLESLELSLWLNDKIGAKARTDRALQELRNSTELLDGEAVKVRFEQIATAYIGPASPDAGFESSMGVLAGMT